ncbi:hypothetical protein FO519_004614 [Halicephalobus sp. NKZ332]|nr:hypothetical protein FO519_004614 [Halicephalobus sp. NKZ332]
MGDTNVFNTFSFKKWSERLKEKKIEDESQRQRLEQVTRLKDKLRRERELRDQADLLTDSDIEKLIEYLNAGNSLTAVPFDPSMMGMYDPNGYPYDPAYDPAYDPTYDPNAGRPKTAKRKTDDDIFNEIMTFYKKNPDHNIGEIPDVIENDPMSDQSWYYNKRFGERGVNHQAKLFSDVPQATNFLKDFEYNRKVGA